MIGLLVGGTTQASTDVIVDLEPGDFLARGGYSITKLMLLKARAQNAIFEKMHTSAKNDGKSDPQDDPPRQ
jgi:hypothetical protein